MKRLFFFTVFVTAFCAGFAQCPTSHVACCPMAVPDSLTDWQPRSACFSWTCGFNGLQDVADVPVDLVYSGWTRVAVWGYTTSADAEIVIMSRNCDSILGRKCLQYPADSLVFYNGAEAFTVWISTHDTALSVFWTAQPTAATADIGWQCETVQTVQSLQQRLTYQAIDLMHGIISEPSETIPQGLSLRSDGIKVMRQGVTGGLSLLFAAFALAYIIRHIWRHGDI